MPGEAFLPGQKCPGRHFCQGAFQTLTPAYNLHYHTLPSVRRHVVHITVGHKRSPSFSLVHHRSALFLSVQPRSPSFSFVPHRSASFTIVQPRSPSFSLVYHHSALFSLFTIVQLRSASLTIVQLCSASLTNVQLCSALFTIVR